MPCSIAALLPAPWCALALICRRCCRALQHHRQGKISSRFYANNHHAWLIVQLLRAQWCSACSLALIEHGWLMMLGLSVTRYTSSSRTTCLFLPDAHGLSVLCDVCIRAAASWIQRMHCCASPVAARLPAAILVKRPAFNGRQSFNTDDCDQTGKGLQLSRHKLRSSVWITANRLVMFWHRMQLLRLLVSK